MSRDTILTESGCTVEGKAFVVVRWADEVGQLSPAAARTLGLQIIMAADAAEHDAAMHRALAPVLGVEAIAGLLVRMRVERGTMPTEEGS